MSDDKSAGSGNVRRVYALPAEMVDRITAFQTEKGLGSEVEAVRRLIDEALMSRDDLESIINRLLNSLGQVRIPSEAAKSVLVGHPLVQSVHFENKSVSFTLKDGSKAQVWENGDVVTALGWEPNDPKKPFSGGYIAPPF